MLANNALKIIFSHPAATAGLGGLIGGSGALVYNAFSKPTLDEYGNPIESNDINPLLAAGIGSGVGLVSGVGARMMTPQSNRSGNVYSQAGRQTPQEVQGYDDFRGAAIPIRGNESVRNRQPNPTAMPNSRLPSGFQEQPKNLVYEYFDESPFVRTIVQDVYSPDEQYVYSVAGGKQFHNPDRLSKLIQTPPRQFQEEFITTRLPLANNPVAWNVVSPDPDEAARYQKWLESEAIIRGRNQNPQVIGNDLFDADGNMILNYPEKKIV